LFPPVATLWSATIFTLAVAAVASTVSLASRESAFRKKGGQGLSAVALVLALIPWGFHSGVELAWATVSGLVTAAWLIGCAFLLLRNHAAAWVFFGVLTSGVPAAVRILAQPAAADRIAGAGALVLLAVGVAALIGGGEHRPAVAEAPVAVV